MTAMQTPPKTAVDPAAELAFIRETILAEAGAVSQLVDRLSDAVHHAVALIADCQGAVVATGMGKSGLIAQKISATLASVGRPSHFLHPSEAVHGDLGRVSRSDVVLALSYSGTTQEVLTLISLVRPDGVPVISMSKSDETPLAKAADVHLAIGEIAEACEVTMAPTSTTTAMLALGDAIALAASRRRSFDADDFHKLHPGGSLGAGLRPVVEVLRYRVGEGGRPIPVVQEDGSLGEALQRAEAPRRPGAMLVVDASGRLTGIFTDGDLRRLLLRGDLAATMRAPMSEVMTRDPEHLAHTSLVRDAVALVRDRRQDEIPVVDEQGQPIGLLDVQDLIALKVIQE